MITLLLVSSFTCSEIKGLISNVRAYSGLSETIKEEIVVEFLNIAPPGCKDLQTELGG